MTSVRHMTAVASACLTKPGKVSVWSDELRKYVSNEHPQIRQLAAEQPDKSVADHPPISPTFKLVFLTAACGTLLFVIICVTATIFAGKDMPTPLEKLVSGLFDLAKIGFGAVVGLLGGKELSTAVGSSAARGT